MGDRGNVYMVDTNNAERGIYLYTHWRGFEWPEVLRQALIFGRGRWNDEVYLQRILISRMFMDCHEGEIGGGVSTFKTDNEYPITVVNLATQVVGFSVPGLEKDFAQWQAVQGFQEYVQQEPASYPRGLLDRFHG